MITQIKGVRINSHKLMQNSQKSYSSEVKLKDLITLNCRIDIKKSQRFLHPQNLKPEVVYGMAEAALKGMLHQNITLVNTEKCYKSTGDPAWKEYQDHSGEFQFLILDGSHRITNFRNLVAGNYNFDIDINLLLECKLPVRFITKMNHKDLGLTFVVNNSGVSPSKQDRLTHLGTKIGDFIVEFEEKYRRSVFSKIYGTANADRRNDNRIRLISQLFLGNGKEQYDTSFETGKNFYLNTLPNEDLFYFLNRWVSLLKIAIPQSQNQKKLRQYTALSPIVLKEIMQNFYISDNGLKEIFKDFRDFHLNNEKNQNQYSIDGLSLPYSELIQDRGSKYFQLKLKVFRGFISDNISKWIDGAYINKK